jgi:hypothetical protein
MNQSEGDGIQPAHRKLEDFSIDDRFHIQARKMIIGEVSQNLD